MAKIFKKPTHLIELKQSLYNLDEAFREFEKRFLGNVLFYSTRNHKAKRQARTGTVVFKKTQSYD